MLSGETAKILATEKAYLLENLEKLAAEYPGKYLVIQGESVYGAFETYDEGVQQGVALLGSGPFLVRSVLNPDDETLTVPALSVGVPLIADCQ
ncbi:MAG: hypothetical protein OXP66_00765 [Candidatus Tectomicrobia bacterium]|nr:hypothetical protein [Candidatus Tectomicrobia bacterium]